MHWIYLIHEFHNLSWITEINELFHDILIYWEEPFHTCKATKLELVFLDHLEKDIPSIQKTQCIAMQNTTNSFHEQIDSMITTDQLTNTIMMRLDGYIDH